MSLAICPVCRQKVSVQAPKCPHCGQPFGNTLRNTQINWIVGIVLTLMLLSLVWYFYDLHNSPEAKLKRFVEKQSSEYYENKRAQNKREIERMDEIGRQFKELDKLYDLGTINKEFYDRTYKKLNDEVERKYKRIR